MSERFAEQGFVLHEFLFMSNHYHMAVSDACGCVPDFVRDFNSLLSRQLNALRAECGTNIERHYNLVEVGDAKRLLGHCAYALANAVHADLVEKIEEWRGPSSLELQYGEGLRVHRPLIGLWKGKANHATDEESKRSKRAVYAGRSRLPDVATLMIHRPPGFEDLNDQELRKKVLDRARLEEGLSRAVRAMTGKRVLGWEQVVRQHYNTTPESPARLFALRPVVSASTPKRRNELLEEHRQFRLAYLRAADSLRLAAARLQDDMTRRVANAARRVMGAARKIVFPVGTWAWRKYFGPRGDLAPTLLRALYPAPNTS